MAHYPYVGLTQGFQGYQGFQGVQGAPSISGLASIPSVTTGSNATGATLISGTLTLQPATTAFGGVITVNNQSFSGLKNFTNNIIVNTITIWRGNNNAATNIGIGSNTLLDNTGNQNTVIGYQAVSSITSSSFTTAVGHQSLKNVLGNNNTAIGNLSGLLLTTGFQNTFIGSEAGAITGQLISAQNSTAIGYQAITTKNNQIVLGTSNTVETILHGNTYIGTPLPVLNAKLTVIGNGSDPAFRVYKNPTDVVSGLPIFSVRETGRIGIGQTVSPDFKVEIRDFEATDYAVSSTTSFTPVNENSVALSLQNAEQNSGGACYLQLGPRNSQNFTNYCYIGAVSVASVYAPRMVFGMRQGSTSYAEKMRINTDGIGMFTNGNPNSSAALEIASTIKGFLPPRMTNAQRVAIVSPANGLMVYCTDVPEGLYVYTVGSWVSMVVASGTWGINITGNAKALGGYLNQTEYTILDGPSPGNGPVWKVRWDSATVNRYIDFGFKDGNGTYSEGLKLYNGSNLTWLTQPIMHTGNVNSYAPTLTGTGATGTSWAIGITGNAATATNSSSLGSIAADRYVFGDGANGRSKQNGNANTSDSTNSSGFYFGNTTTGMPSTDWWNWLTVAGNSWSGTDGYRWQMAGSFWSNDWRLRRQQSGGWNSWVNIIHSDNYSSYALPLSGGTLTGALNGTSAIFSGNVTALAFFNSSDARLKNIIERDGDTIKFTWKDKRDSKIHIGYIAQEVQEKYPDQVTEGEDGMLTVNYIEVLVAKIQELENRIKQLEK